MAGVTYRAATDADVPALAELFNDSNRADGVPEVVAASELGEELSGGRTALPSDSRVAMAGGRIVGVVFTVHIPSEVVHERCIIRGTVAPAHRGQGIGRALMQWATEHGSEILRTSHSDLPKRLVVDAHERRVADRRLFTRLGFQPRRWFEELLRPLTDVPPAVAVEGISVIGWPDDRDDELLEVRNAAFADHWGSTPTTADAWQHQVRGFASRPDLSFVAVDGDDRPVAICVNARYEADDEVTGRREGWIMTLGTLAEWRGRGVASALIIASLTAFADVGFTHGALGVDGDSPTGAGRLYRSLGFQVTGRSVLFQLDV